MGSDEKIYAPIRKDNYLQVFLKHICEECMVELEIIAL